MKSFIAGSTAALPSALAAGQAALANTAAKRPRFVDFATKTGRYVAMSAAAHVAKNLDDLEALSAWIARSGWCASLSEEAWDAASRTVIAKLRSGAEHHWTPTIERDFEMLARSLGEALVKQTPRKARGAVKRVAA